ncbi:MAG TPA: LacI family DNA-binding transcriptional regulator [Acidobacteriaceae bacterium]|nr:LacI family DNA-binding transcriptional regulator [Acidobacteriaceae bacterium]
MQDVAKLAKVGTMTVSRVLNGNSKVSEENRNRVLSAIRALDYVPNQVARSLRQQRSSQIGIIVPNIRDPFFAICSDAIGAVAKRHDYTVVLATSDEDAETEYTEATRLLRRSVDGLIVTPAAHGRSHLGDPAFRDFPIVAVDRPVPGGGVDCVVVRNELGSYLGTQHLIAHKHRRIAHLTLSADLYTMGRRVRGYRKAIEEAGLTPEVAVVVSQEETLQAVKDFVQGKRPTTAFFCGNNVVSRGVFHAISALGLRIPEDIAVIGFDDFDTADILQPAMTVVRQPIEDIGRIAAEVLFAHLQQQKGATPERIRQRVLPVELVLRNSCGCATPTHPAANEKSEHYTWAYSATATQS